MALTTGQPSGARVGVAEEGLAAPSGIPRTLVAAGVLIALVGVASLLEGLVRGMLVGFGDPAASGQLSLPLPLAAGLLLVGVLIGELGRVLARADGRPR